MTLYGGTDLARAFRTVRRNTIQIAEDIPAESYSYVAAPGTRPIDQILVHIALSPGVQEDMHRTKHVSTLVGYDFGGLIARGMAEAAKPRTKEEIVALLQSEGDRIADWFESLTPEFLAETFTDPSGQNPRTRFESLLGVKEHEMHHRAQLMLMERMLGIVPHLTRQMQERMAARS